MRVAVRSYPRAAQIAGLTRRQLTIQDGRFSDQHDGLGYPVSNMNEWQNTESSRDTPNGRNWVV
jgi:hypothetical protein